MSEPACVPACLRACERACVRACVYALRIFRPDTKKNSVDILLLLLLVNPYVFFTMFGSDDITGFNGVSWVHPNPVCQTKIFSYVLAISSFRFPVTKTFSFLCL